MQLPSSQQAVAAAAAQSPWQPQQQLIAPDGETAKPGQLATFSLPQQSSRTATAAAVPAATVQATISKLRSVQNVVRVEQNHPRYPITARPPNRQLHRADHHFAHSSRNLAATTAESLPSGIGRSIQATASCPIPATNPDTTCGRDGTECTPYGIKMVQADDLSMVQVSKDFKKNVMFCVIDTGLDPLTDFDPGEEPASALAAQGLLMLSI